MEFIARTVTHPNPKLDKKSAYESLTKHPEFKPGTIIIGMGQENGHWVARLHEPKLAGPPPFLDDAAKEEGAPMDEPKPDLDDMDAADEEAPKDEDKNDGEKATLEDLTKLVREIAEHMGISPDGGKDGEGPEEPMDDPLPPVDGPPEAPPGPPKSGPAGSKEMIHRKAPVGVTPVGSPAFASTKTAKPKVASFEVEEPWAGTIKEAREAIEAQYGEHGYKVKKIAEALREDGTRVIRARVSVR